MSTIVNSCMSAADIYSVWAHSIHQMSATDKDNYYILLLLLLLFLQLLLLLLKMYFLEGWRDGLVAFCDFCKESQF